MNHRDAALELGLHFGIARGGKLSLPSFSSCWPKALQFSAAVTRPATNILVWIQP